MPYCQQSPKNAELNGLFQCQFKGANPNVFVGGIALGQPGTIPLGHTGPLNPLGSCPANPGGPIADGTQLVDLTQNPGVGNGGASPPASVSPATNVSASENIARAATSGGFRLQNGLDAQKLNAQFTTLTANSPCTGEMFLRGWYSSTALTLLLFSRHQCLRWY